MTNPTIVLDHLTKSYGKARGVVKLDLEVDTGEVFGFLGPNGAGKTTTIRTMLDLIRPTSGSITILGLDSRRDSVEIRRRVGYLPGELNLYPNLTGHDTLTYFANLRGGVDWSHVDELTHRLEADLTKKVGELSSGNRQKVGLIQAFMNRPSLLILDEPSSGLDPLVQRQFQRMMREHVAAGGTVFLSSHTLSEVQRVADRVGIIREGRLIAVEEVASLRSKAIRRIDLQYQDAVEPGMFAGVAGVRDIRIDNHHVSFSFDGDMHDLLTVAMEHSHLLDISTREADLEEIFLTYYQDGGSA